MMKIFWTLLPVAAAWAQTGLMVPQAGFVRDTNSAWRPVYGIAGNFVVGDPAATQVVSAAFSGSFAWVKTDSALLLMDRGGQALASMDSPAGPALFAFSQDGTPSFALLASNNTLVQWNAGTLQQLISLDGRVVSLASADAEHVAVILEQDDGLREVRLHVPNGEVVSQTPLPGLRAPVLLLATGVLIYTDADGIVVRKPTGEERHVPAQLPDNAAFQQMGSEWIQVGNCALRITENREQLYALPEAQQ